MKLVENVMNAIGDFFYGLFSTIFTFVDLFQKLFFSLAGVGNIKFGNVPVGANNDGGENSTGLIYHLLTSDLIKNLFLSIMLLAVFLIIIFTAMAFIKNAYASKQKTWQEIVGNAFKGLANFIFIPVCCLLGVWLGNILLVAINSATSTGGSASMSRKLFICSAYNANRYREDNIKNLDEDQAQDLEDWAARYSVEVDVKANVDSSEYYAEIVDRVFAESNIDISSNTVVSKYYKTIRMNYLVLIVAGVFMLYVLVSLAYAMVKRMFILLMLFVVSPALCAMYPLDEGSAVANWKKEFIKNVLSAYGAVAGMNLFFSILPIVFKIDVISSVGWDFGMAQGVLNIVFQILIMISGLFVVKEFMGTLSNWIGGDNALTTGEGMKKNATGALKKYATSTVKTTSGAFKAVGKARGAALEAGGGLKGFGAGMLNFGKQGLGAGLNAIDKSAFGGEGKKLLGAFGDGKKDFEKERDEKATKAIEKQILKEKQGRRVEFDKGEPQKDFTGNIIGYKGRNVYDADNRYKFIKEATKNGFSEDEAFSKLSKLTGSKVLDLKDEYAETKEKKDVAKELKLKEEAKKERAAENQDLIDALSSAMRSTVVGGRSHIEDTMKEHEKVQVLKDIREAVKGSRSSVGNDSIEKLLAALAVSEMANGKMAQVENALYANPHGSKEFRAQVHGLVAKGEELTVDKIHGNGLVTKQVEASFSKIADNAAAYNAALADKKLAEENAKIATKAFMDEMEKAAKENSQVKDALKKFKDAADYSTKALEKLAKDLNDLSKK